MPASAAGPAGLLPMHADLGSRIFHELGSGADGAPHELTAAIGTDEMEGLRRAIDAESALESADVGFRGGRQIPVATFAIRAEFE